MRPLACRLVKEFHSGLYIVDSISNPLKIYCDNYYVGFYPKNNKRYGYLKYIEINI